MPIIKAITVGPSRVYTYHSVERVEFCRVDGQVLWSGHYRSFTDGEEARTPGMRAPGYEIATSVPLVPLGMDPIAAFEAAAVLSPQSEFFGGQVVPHATVYTPAEWARRGQWEAVKTGRDAALAGGVDTPYGRFDSDLTSIVNVIGAASIAAQMPDTWSDQWILADRSVVTLNKAQLMEVGAILADFRSRTYRRGDELYRAIQEAATADDVRAITWSPGVA